jgi:hypothetical protein
MYIKRYQLNIINSVKVDFHEAESCKISKKGYSFSIQKVFMELISNSLKTKGHQVPSHLYIYTQQTDVTLITSTENGDKNRGGCYLHFRVPDHPRKFHCI